MTPRASVADHARPIAAGAPVVAVHFLGDIPVFVLGEEALLFAPRDGKPERIAVHGGGLANLLFCPPGTRVLELTPDCEYRPFFWAIAQKLGLLYSVLPCPTNDGSFNGDLIVDLPRLRALLRIVRSTLA